MKSFVAQKTVLVVSCLALFLVLMLTSGTVHAAQPGEGNATTRIVREQVNWNLPADVCAQLPAGVSLSGTGTRFAVITTKKNADGSTLIVNSDFVVGTATDSNSATYNFVYTNQNRHTVPAGGAPIQVKMTDVFLLTGNGGVNNYDVAFKWSWTYSPPEEEWPPVHNWKKIYTLGDSLTCDPL